MEPATLVFNASSIIIGDASVSDVERTLKGLMHNLKEEGSENERKNTYTVPIQEETLTKKTNG